MLYMYLLMLFFGSSAKPVVKNIGEGRDFGNIKGICQWGTRSHSQMIVKLISFDKYKVALLKEWIFGGKEKLDTTTYNFKIDGKSIKIEGMPYFTGMYTYSPTFIAIFENKVDWRYISSDSCKKSTYFKYPGKGLFFFDVRSKGHIKPCNIMSINTEVAEFSPFYETKNNHLFFLRVGDSLQDSIKVVIAREGKLQKSQYIREGELYLGIMDNAHYDVQIGQLDINLPEALRLLGQ